ncbi:accessory gene regulator B [Natranaerovirga pectinivora]|uniref:Accessory gene regulator B n=1 Tax=Natranaerovirga pectinivora TaxID=682400 RepID=A0A4R3MMG3_9FIRM|nr:accessory gene regulator B [Natranaerovirga pectinivora]
MTNRLINLITYNIYKQNIINHVDLRKMQYGMQVVLNEFIKIATLLFLFHMINQIPLFLFSFAVLVSIRLYSGGLHNKTTLGCFITSLGFFLITVLVPQYFNNISVFTSCLLTLMSIIIIYIYSPVTSDYRPIKYNQRIIRAKYTSVIITLLWVGILYLIVKNNTFFTSGLLTLSIHSLQLILGRRINHVRV